MSFAVRRRYTAGPRQGAHLRFVEDAPRPAPEQSRCPTLEAEHELIDPALAAVEAGLTDPAHEHPDLAAHIDNLASILHSHLAHEERDALPLIKVTVTAKEWHQLSKDAMKKMNYRWVTEMVPWLVDGLPPERSRVALANIPAPLRLLNRYSWEPRHRRTRRWE
jgi:hypothetical protein